MKKFGPVWLSAVFAWVTGVAAGGPLQIDYQHSKIEVAVQATVDSFVGHLDKYAAAIDGGSATNLPASAKVSFDFADLKTGNPDRDAEMLKWLGYSANPKATFRLTGWQQNGATNLAAGELTIHGVKQAILMPVVVKNEGGTCAITGEANFDYRDFNLPKIRKMLLLTVAPHLQVNFHLVGNFTAAK